MSSGKKVSLIIPVYNRDVLIRECLDSVMNQTYPKWEAIVVDDGSTDRTKEVVKEYIKADARIRLVERDRNPKGGATCRNIGASIAEGEYLIFLDSDDVLSRKCLENRVNFFFENPHYDFVAFPTRLFKEVAGDTNLYWNVPVNDQNDLFRFVNFDMPWHTTGPIWKKAAYMKLGGFNELALSMQDWELHIRAIINELKYIVIDDLNFADVHYRRHDESTVSGNWWQKEILLNKIHLLDALVEEVTNKVVITREIKNAYAYYYYIFCVELAKRYNINLAFKSFKGVKMFDLLPIGEYYFWQLYIFVVVITQHNPRINRFGVRLMNFFAYRFPNYNFIERPNRANTFLQHYWDAEGVV